MASTESKAESLSSGTRPYKNPALTKLIEATSSSGTAATCAGCYRPLLPHYGLPCALGRDAATTSTLDQPRQWVQPNEHSAAAHYACFTDLL